MRLLHDRVLVKLAPPRSDALILAEAMPLPPSVGKVVAVGPKCRVVTPDMVVAFAPEALAEDVSGLDGLKTPHVIVREHEIDLRMEA